VEGFGRGLHPEMDKYGLRRRRRNSVALRPILPPVNTISAEASLITFPPSALKT